MPIYEYRCSACGFEKDALQKMSDAPLVDCPNCGKAALVKLVSAAGFQLKGSGWYATDFKGSGTAKAAGKANAAAGAKPDSAAGGADAGGAKPAESSAAKSEGTTSTPASTPTSTPGAGD